MRTETDAKLAVEIAVSTGEPVRLVNAEGMSMGVISTPKDPLPPGPCCEDHAEAVIKKIVHGLRNSSGKFQAMRNAVAEWIEEGGWK